MENTLQIIVLLSIATVATCGTSSCGSCQYDLVTGPYGVSDEAITASSTHSHCALERVRINSSQSWCPAYTGNGHYVQVEFRDVSLLKVIQTMGRAGHSQWVASYSVNISMDGLTWMSILDTIGNVQIFPGNVDVTTVVTNVLEGTVIAKYIRIISVSGTSYKSMRLEVNGCPYSEISSGCHRWEAKLGSNGDILPLLMDIFVSNLGLCGIQCYRHSDCDSFLYDVTSSHCRLFPTARNGSQNTVNLEGIWYFVKKIT